VLALKAPAKVNLTLEVLGKRPDGYHEIRSIFQSVDLYDTLNFSGAEDISLSCNAPGWSAENSLVSKAVSLLRESAALKNGAEIKLGKRIPYLSGLGGDSSDAAAVLRGLNELCGLSLSNRTLLSLADRLGSDVPFFIDGGTALVAGRGDVIEPLPAPPDLYLVLVVPDIPVDPGKTGRMYAAVKPSHFTDGSMTYKLAETLRKRRKPDSSMLFNTFENVAFDVFPGLDVYKKHLVKLGATRVHLAGSGPALFTLFDNKSKAEDLYRRCLDQKMRTYLVKTCEER
jgi:4-diphosphocytidyl-2-C-methyl-D-erythritol kinase